MLNLVRQHVQREFWPDISKICLDMVVARVYNVERVSNAPYPCRKHSRESNVIVTQLKMACYDVYTLIKIGIDRQGLLPPLPQCLKRKRNPPWRSKRKIGAELTAQQLELGYPPTSSLLFAGIAWGCSLTEMLTSKYVTASHARHVTFPRVFAIGLWGVRYSLYIIYSWYYLKVQKVSPVQKLYTGQLHHRQILNNSYGCT